MDPSPSFIDRGSHIEISLSARHFGGRRLSDARAVLTGRRSSGADRFTELVAENGGAEVRYFEDIHAGRRWVAQG